VTFEPQNVYHIYQGFPSGHSVAGRRRYFQAITAAALLMPAGLFRKHNGFYEEYRNGFEDVDLCLRIRATGKYFSCVPESLIYHLESQTPGRSDAEADNAGLLARRCSHLFRTDKHVIGRDDGFVPFINDGFGISLRMAVEAEAALCREAGGHPLSHWHSLTQAHPLWIAGREFLAQALEQQGRLNDALPFLSEIACIEMRKKTYERLIQAAAQAGNAKVSTLAEQDHAVLVARNRDRIRARSFLQLAGKQRDSVLESLYEQAIRESST